MAVKKRAFGLGQEEPVVRTSIRMSQAMADDIGRSLEKSGRKSRERSTWLSSIIEEFIADDEAPELVAEEFYESPRGSSVTLSLSLRSAVDQAISGVLEKTSAQYGAAKDRSSVVRAAVMAHLLQQGASQT
jgi:hypothetical protein|tara:strand:+ start:21839 stop:22231 length:393 start_codon:yes stop_codon:yes gene_type:complete